MKTEQEEALDELAKEFAETIFGLPPTKEELEKLREWNDQGQD